MRIGIFGGSFNPPHKMHYSIGVELLNKNYVNKIIYVPTGIKYKYKNNLIANCHRVKMLELMIGNDERFIISDYELKDNNVFTYDTLDYFKKLYPDDEIYFVCGTDNLSYVDAWDRGFYLLENYKFLVINRCTDPVDRILERFYKYKNNIIVSDILPNGLSSTEIRNKIKNTLDISDILNEEVINYNMFNNLYK